MASTKALTEIKSDTICQDGYAWESPKHGHVSAPLLACQNELWTLQGGSCKEVAPCGFHTSKRPFSKITTLELFRRDNKNFAKDVFDDCNDKAKCQVTEKTICNGPAFVWASHTKDAPLNFRCEWEQGLTKPGTWTWAKGQCKDDSKLVDPGPYVEGVKWPTKLNWRMLPMKYRIDSIYH